LENKSFELVAAVDPNLGQEIDPYLSGKVASAIKELAGADIDLVVIASPTHTHLEICRNVEEYLKPKAVLIEKPTGLTLGECEKISSSLKSVPLVLVNYQRNYNSDFIVSLKSICNSNYLKGTVYYSNGTLNNASHGLALLISILGEPTNVYRLHRSKRESEGIEDIDFVVEFDKKVITFLSTPESNYSMFRIELFGSENSWIYDASLSHVEIRNRESDPIYSNRFNLSITPEYLFIPDSESFLYVYRHIAGCIGEKERMISKFAPNLELALAVHKTIAKARESIA